MPVLFEGNIVARMLQKDAKIKTVEVKLDKLENKS